MSQTHYYYALNRKRAERILDLTWNQFLGKFGWPTYTQWETLGEFLAYSVDRPTLPEKPTDIQLAPLLSWTLRKTIARASPQYYVLLSLNDALSGRWSFVREHLGVESLEGECDALIHCAVHAHERGDIDDRTYWTVLALNNPSPYSSWGAACAFFGSLVDKVAEAIGAERRGADQAGATAKRSPRGLTADQRGRSASLMRRFGRSKPIFDWQPASAVRDGHNALGEEDTVRFANFLGAAWKRNWPVWGDSSRGRVRFRDFELTGALACCTRSFRGNCLVHYYGS